MPEALESHETNLDRRPDPHTRTIRSASATEDLLAKASPHLEAKWRTSSRNTRHPQIIEDLLIHLEGHKLRTGKLRMGAATEIQAIILPYIEIFEGSKEAEDLCFCPCGTEVRRN